MSPEVSYWLTRRRYRMEFGLTAEEMDREPIKEVLINQAVWIATHRQRQLEEYRSQQGNQ